MKRCVVGVEKPCSPMRAMNVVSIDDWTQVAMHWVVVVVQQESHLGRYGNRRYGPFQQQP